MGVADELVTVYERFVSLPWKANVSGSEREWMLVYPPDQERRIRFRMPNFEGVTKKAGHEWVLVDVTNAFGTWLGSQEYAEGYFRDPDALNIALEGFVAFVVSLITGALQSAARPGDSVVAVVGAGSLFPFARVSDVLKRVSGNVAGRLLVFFPGEKDGSTYRLLNARDGWNYLAMPITASRE
jgi:hypothetical protein